MTHSLMLGSQDNGLSVAQRAWMMRFDGAVVTREFKTKATEVLVFDVQAKWLGRQGASFDQWDDGQDKRRHVEALFQLFIVSIAKMTDSYLASDGAMFQNAKSPFKLFIETVLCDPEYERGAADIDYDAQQREWTAQMLTEVYRGNVTAEKLLSHMSSLDANSAEQLNKIQFMNGYAHRRVASYRFWVFINEPTVSLAESILEVFKKCCDRETERLSHDKLAADAGTRSKKRAAAGGGSKQRTGGEISSAVVADLINPQERYWLLNTPTTYVFAVGSYLSKRSLSHTKKDDIAFSARMPVHNPQNEAHPRNVFSARRYFTDCARKRTDIDKSQRTLDRYYNRDTNEWSFTNARANCVLVIGSESWKNRSLLTKYTPHYQLLNIEPRLAWNPRLDYNNVSMHEVLGMPPALPTAPLVLAPQAAATATAVRAPAIAAAAGGGSSIADDDDDNDSLSELSGVDVLVVQPLDEALAAGPMEHFQPARGGSDDNDDNDEESDSSEGAIEELRREFSRALLGPVENMADANRAVELENMPPPSREAAREAREREQAEAEENYALMLQLDMRDLQARQRAAEVASHGQLGGTSATVCHEMRVRYFINELPRIEATVAPGERQLERLKMSVRGIDEYIAKAKSPHANVSGPHQAMNGWAMEQRRLGEMRFQRKLPFIDTRLSVFAHMVMQVYADAENLCAMHTSHDVLFLLYVASRSALLYDRDVLRNNVLLFGEHATSKSFALTELCKKMLIPNTFLSVTSQSSQASATDTHTNDLVMIHEELQQSLISKSSRDNEMQDAFKDSLTRGASSRLFCYLADNGRRQQLVSQSEKNMVVFGACNLKREQIADPIADRMIMCHQVPRNRVGASIAQTMASRFNRSHEQSSAVATMQHDYYLRQVIHNDVEKFIMLGLLSEPHLECFKPIYNFYEQVLNVQFSVCVKRRQSDQLRMMLRSLVIMSAIEWLYNSPAGFCYGMSYSPYHLLLLEPMLHDTEELVYFVLDMCRHTLVDPNQEALIEFMRTVWIPELLTKAVPSLSAARAAAACPGGSETQSKSIDDMADLNAAAAAGTTAAAASTTAPLAISAEQAKKETDSLTVFFRSKVITTTATSSTTTGGVAQRTNVKRTDVFQAAVSATESPELRAEVEREVQAQLDRMAALPDNLGALGLTVTEMMERADREHAINGRMAAAAAKKSSGKVAAATELGPNERRVVDYNYFVLPEKKSVLATAIATHMQAINFRRAMSAQTIIDVFDQMSRQTIPTKQFKRAAPGQWPPVAVDSKARYDARSSQPLQFVGGCVAFHSSLAFFERGSPHEHAINQCMNQFTPVGFFIAGRPVSDKMPHLAYVRRSMQTRRIPFVVNGKMTVQIGMSYNRYSTIKRLEWLGIPLTEVAKRQFDPIYSDAYARSLPGAVVAEPMIYPDDQIKRDVMDARRNMDVQQLSAAGISVDAYGNRLGRIADTAAEPTWQLSARERALMAVSASAYAERVVYTEEDYHTDKTESALFDRDTIARIDLSAYNDPTVTRAPAGSRQVRPPPVYRADDGDDDFDGARVPAKRVHDATVARAATTSELPPSIASKTPATGANGMQIDSYAEDVEQLEREQRWQAQGFRHRSVLPNSLSNLEPPALDQSDDDDNAEDDAAEQEEEEEEEEDPEEVPAPKDPPRYTTVSAFPWLFQQQQARQQI